MSPAVVFVGAVIGLAVIADLPPSFNRPTRYHKMHRVGGRKPPKKKVCRQCNKKPPAPTTTPAQ